MTEKQKRFADEYLIDCNATRAYKTAYPSIKKDHTAESNGYRMLRNAEVETYINERLEQMHDEKTADAKEVMEYLTAVMRGKESDEVLKMVDGTQIKSELSASTRDRLKAAELIGKRYGIFTEKINVSGETSVMIVDDLEDDAD